VEIEWEVLGQALVARLRGELDLHTAHLFKEGVEGRLGGPVRHLVVNLAGLTFIDSSGLGALLGRLRWLRERGGRMALVGTRGRIQGVLELSGLARLVPLFRGERSAAAAVEREGGEVEDCAAFPGGDEPAGQEPAGGGGGR